MNTGKTLFAQVMECLPLHAFRQCVHRYQGHYKTKRFSCLDQFLCMSFAQMTSRESLRDIETCLRSMHRKLYHMGLRGQVSRRTLADANETRDWRLYADFAQILIHRARALYRDESNSARTGYLMDSLNCHGAHLLALEAHASDPASLVLKFCPTAADQPNEPNQARGTMN